MVLKYIEINGFKSFANKIRFEFPNGITGIVGPNGSGKSNIGDAVRWVLGEQSAKQLRGARMEDVIFSGTETRKPMGYAYVSITFDNSGHTIPIDFEEVVVARRVYRSGESEYLLNGSVCRRKDIVSLFYDTGIGKEGYSIIGQGQVEKILSGKIEDSRELFDEAAGIAKYKKNRAVAQKSLDQERQNLERVTDILNELEQRVGPLERQAKKAREYLKLRDREKNLDIHLFLYDHDRIQADLQEHEKNAAIVTEDLRKTRDHYEEIKGKNNELSDQIDQLDQTIEKAEEGREALRSGKEEKEGQILVLDNQRDTNEQMASHYLEIADQSEKERDEKKEILSKQEAQIRSEKETLAEITESLKEIETELLEKVEIRNNKEARVLVRSQEMMDLISEHTDMKEQMSRFKTLEEQVRIRNAEYNSRFLSARSEKKKNEQDVADLKDQITAAQESADLAGKEKERIAALEEAKYLERKQCEETVRDLNQEFLRQRSRHEALSSMSERYEGYNRASRYIMEQKASNPEIIGVVADIITLDKEYETAIEIALGSALQNIVTENNRIARKMIEELKSNRLGRATFLPLTDIRRRNISFSPSILEDEGVIGVASSLVKVEDRYRALMESLLGRTIVVDTVENALMIARKNNFNLRLVTLDGELLNPGGSITGGAYKKNSNLLGRRREVEESKNIMNRSLEEYRKKSQDLEQIKTDHRALKASLEEAGTILDQKELDLHDLKNRLPLLTEQGQELDRELSSLQKERDILEEQLKEISVQIEELSRTQEDSEAIHEEKNISIRDLNEELDQINKEIEELENVKQEKTMALSACEQQISFLTSDCERLRQDILRCENNITENKKEADTLKEANQEIAGEIERLTAKARQLEDRLAAIQDDLRQKKQTRADYGKKQRLLISDMEDENERLLNLEKEATRLTARKEKLERDLETGIDYMWEQYEETYNHLLSLKEYEIRPSEVSGYRKEKKEVGRSIKDLGNVNVNAIEEYKEAGERYDFLKKQVSDIEEAEAQLVTMINNLNRSMKAQFNEQFANIRTMFTKVFRDLFEGGTADLELMDEQDVLECGIRIIAQPPGKKLQNILLLSGGERALTAIALLFAIQNLKPSPFCLLDEIEAALDDANILRFSRYLKELAKDTQFIVITHRKGTMNAMDSLYGITMQEKGISTLISVDLIDKDLK